MNQEKLQNVFIGLLALGLILVGGGMYLFGMQLQTVATSVKGIQVGVTQLQAVVPAVTASAAVPKTQESVSKKVTVGGVTFDLPANWNVERVEGNEALIQVPDPAYKVFIPLTVREITGSEGKSLSDNHAFDERNLTARGTYGASLFYEACAPALYCAYIQSRSIYVATFEEPVSDQPVPKDLDGVWFPDTTVTQDQILTVLKSAR